MTDNTALILPEETKVLKVGPNPNPFKRKLQEAWMPQIMEWAGQGLTMQKIADKVKETYQVDISYAGVRLAIKRVQADRSQLSKSVVRQNVGEHISNDLEVLKAKKAELVELSNQFKAAKDWKNYYQAIDKIRDYFKMSFELSGIHESDTSEQDNAKQDLMSQLEKFAYGQQE